ncbi:hypothetical protein [Halopenitus persicus]|uniref:Uncharacterized protein n=1 Tax=Halopenitus persicus TaxID=1048396 RepID=A0A1H3KYB0_9EURY|nr:hypothetical protein [Halopenitus persicus]SDY56644.1 hypothetical protein SAMN05216564_106193 [Halopenitus persicus]
MELSRRALLSSVGTAGTVAVAGCLDFAAGEGPQGPSGEIDELRCSDDSFRRLDQRFPEEGATYVTAYTPDEVRFELALQGAEKTYGSDLRVVLRCLDQDVDVEIASDEHIAIQRRTAAGWQDVRGTTDGSEATYPDDTKTVGSGGGYTWSLTLREEPVADTLSTVDLEVCPALGVGTHRFVYWGLPGDVAIGRQFEIIG